MSFSTFQNSQPPLIVRFGAMGDMVILTALIRALHDRLDTGIDIACGGWVRPLLDSQPGVAGSLRFTHASCPTYSILSNDHLSNGCA